MDLHGFAQNISVISTVDDKTWGVRMNHFFINNQSIFQQDKAVVRFEPSLPFIYIPTQEWTLFSISIENLYGDIKCNSFKGECAWDMPCDQVDPK
jgi:hypothetical protein